MNKILRGLDRMTQEATENKILDMARIYKNKLESDGIDATIAYRSVYLKVNAYNEGNIDAPQLIEEARAHVKNYDNLLNAIKEADELQDTAARLIQEPLAIMQALYIGKHNKFKGDLNAFLGHGHNKAFNKIMEGKA